MAARLGWNIQTVPNGMAWNAAQDTDESHYEPANVGNVPDITTGLFSLQGGVNRDGGGGAVVWTPTWIPVAADPIPDLTYFGAANQFFRCTGGVASPPIDLYNGELQMRATVGGTPLDGYLRMVVTSDPDYGSAAWDWVGQQCDFAGVPTVGDAPLEVDFTDLSSPEPTDWLWDFGDGNTSTVQNPTHIYATPGLYTVSLTINSASASETKTNYIRVNAQPVVDFERTPTSGFAPLDVVFEDTTTPGSDGGTPIVPDAWHWDFGDGDESTLQNPTHTYNAPGTYDVVFNAFFEGDPLSPTVTKPVVVNQPATIGDFMNVLPISRLIRVDANLTPAGAQAQNLSNLLILGSSPVIDTTERKRDYASLEEVAADFGTTAPEYLAALLWFEQVPQPTTLSIGRMVTSAASGGLRGAPRSAAQQAIAAWNAVTNGSFTYTKDGGAPANITGLNFSAAANLNAVAALIQAALPGITVQWNSTFARFEFTSTTTGPSSAVGFLTPVGSGTDISSMLGGRSTDSGSYLFTGQAAETPIEAVQSFEIAYGRQWYALVVIGAVNADHIQIAEFLEGTNTKHLYGVTTQEGGVLVSTDTTNIAYQLKQLAFKKTMVQYSSSNPYAVVSALARILTTNYGGQNTTITLMYKQEPGIVPENLSTNQMNAAQGFNCNVFALFDNDTAIILQGVTSSGIFVDTVIGTDALVLNLQTDLWNLLYTSTTKIPQTNQGAHLMVTTCENRLAQYVANGFLAPGVWNATGFGSLKTGDYLAKGFYVFAPNVDTQPQADRAARKSVPIQIAAKLAGAVHEINVNVTVNQ